MNTILILVSLVLIVIAGVITLLAFKQEEKKIQKHKEDNLSPEEARKRSQEYEENSISSVVPLQIWTYLITGVVTVILVMVFTKYF